jgi:hypothetical protein
MVNVTGHEAPARQRHPTRTARPCPAAPCRARVLSGADPIVPDATQHGARAPRRQTLEGTPHASRPFCRDAAGRGKRTTAGTSGTPAALPRKSRAQTAALFIVDTVGIGSRPSRGHLPARSQPEPGLPEVPLRQREFPRGGETLCTFDGSKLQRLPRCNSVPVSVYLRPHGLCVNGSGGAGTVHAGSGTRH